MRMIAERYISDAIPKGLKFDSEAVGLSPEDAVLLCELGHARRLDDKPAKQAPAAKPAPKPAQAPRNNYKTRELKAEGLAADVQAGEPTTSGT